MFANLIISLALLGIIAGLVDKLISKEQKETLERWDSRAHGLLESLKNRPFADWLRGPRSLVILFAIALSTLVAYLYFGGTTELEWNFLAICSVVVALSFYILGRSRSNTSFLIKAILLAVFWMVVPFYATFALLRDEEEELFVIIGISHLFGPILLFLIWYFLVLLLPFIIAQTLSVILKALEFFYRYCILNNKLPTMLVFAVLGGIASAYRLIHG